MKNEKVLLFTLAAIQFTHIVDFMIMMPLGPQLMRIFTISPREFGLLVSSYTITAGIFGFMGAFFIDRFDRKTALFFLYTGFTVGTLMCALAPGYLVLLLMRSITGAFGGMLSGLVLSIVGDVIPLERRAGAMGLVMSAFSVASVVGVPLGLYLAVLFNWHAPFFLLAVLGLGVLGLVYYFIPPLKDHLRKKEARPHPIHIITDVLQDANQLRALLLIMLMMLGNFAVIPFISPYLVANVGFTDAQLTYVYLIGGGLTIFTSPAIGRIADRMGHKKVFSIFMLLSIIPLVLVTNLPPVAMWVALIITSMFFVFGGGRMIPAMTLITSTVAPQRRGSFMSLNSSVQQLSSGLASFVAGLIIGTTPEGQMLHYPWVGAISVVASLIAWQVGRTIISRH
jgi:predicted MFS family arabinose efflux permease